MGKVLIMVRTSTEVQQTEDQRNEMIQFCNAEGYTEQIIIEDQGASAIKLNEKYLAMIQSVKDKIENDRDIECIAFWSLDRAWRTEKVYVDLKEFLIAHKVQMLIKNPYLKLLNADGSINGGMEIAISLMTVLAQQEMQTKKDRFARTKKAYREQGKYSGGPNIKFGYKVDENGFLVEDEKDGAVVKKIYELYATGNYANKSLFNEIQSLGLTKKDGTKICYVAVSKILRDTAYIGWTEDENGYIRNYPPILSQDLWDKVKSVRKNNYKDRKKGKRWTFATKLIKCPICGGNMAADMDYYKCWQHNQFAHTPTCSNDISVKISILDGILWNIAGTMHMDYLLNLTDDTITELNKKISSIETKINVINKEMDKIADKKKKVVDTYLEDLITKEERDKRLAKIDKDNSINTDTLNEYKEEIDRLYSLISSVENKEDIDKMTDIMLDVCDETDAEKMYNICHQHIKKVIVTRTTIGEGKDKRLALRIMVTIENGELEYIYAPRKYKGHYVYHNNVPFEFDEIKRL